MATDVLASYAPIAILGALSVVVAYAMFNIGKLLGRPSNPNPVKLSTYECGEVPMGSARTNVDVQYYLYVLVFLVIDVEAAFLVLFALSFSSLSLWQIVAMVLFALLILDGWLYAWKKGALAWSR
ncbi:MAG TPA: NADH-quinone oxidoreductase subunit A [Candidatus Thermoplasmatota archaeon]|jgi:NADH-quinone oxidoreductase subunit A|nr:NADH-quinone oxidoreductase subunit A [Candidatus Thermoplasmatota archaeon]